MVWVLRDRADKDAYAPREHPDYSAAPDLFTIKLHHRGKFMENPKRYVGGSVDYVDLCDADTMSLIELMTMSKECGDLGAVITHYYKHPNGEEEWEETSYPKPLPPEIKVQTGRPKKKRNKVNDVVNADPTRLKRQNTKVKCSYCTEYGHNMRTCPARVADRANGCEREVKTRPKPKPKAAPVEKPSGDNPAGDNPGSEATSDAHNDRGDVHNPTPSVEKPSGTAKRASNPNEGTNAGVLKKKADHVKVNNTPLGIQPQQGGSGSKTSRENIEAKRREMQAKLKKNPVWKI